MREAIQSQYTCTFVRWAEWDGECEQFAVIHAGELIVADGLALLLSELQARVHVPLELAA